MIDSNNFKIDEKLKLNVSRETFAELMDYSNEVIIKNKDLNLISKKTEKAIYSRHIYDSAQSIDFINKNDVLICTDLGSGAGFPGIVLGIIMKTKKPSFKIIFYEKSHHKSKFLNKMSKRFKLNSVIKQENIFNKKNLITDVIISRAFKPLPIIFDIALKNFKKFKYIILFLGRSGEEVLKEAFKIWEFDYEEKKSLTSIDSKIIKISNLKKKNA